jgi:Spy/CpxP family protein refolding chaperone
MERSKGYALMFLLGAFLTGGALGFTADRVIGPDRGKDHRGGRGGGGGGGASGYRQRMAAELDLTAAQQASIDTLLDQKHHQIVALYRPVQPQLDSLALAARVISDSTHAQIKRLLAPAQQVKLDELRAASRRDLAKRRGKDTVGPRIP